MCIFQWENVEVNCQSLKEEEDKKEEEDIQKLEMLKSSSSGFGLWHK